MTTIMHLSKLNLAHLSFGTPKTRMSGSKSIPILYEGKKLQIILPSMQSTFGANQYKPDNPFDIKLNFDESHPETQEKFMELDAHLVQVASQAESCALWLGSPKTKPYSEEIVASKYHPLVTWSKNKQTKEIDPQYPPAIRVKIPNQYGVAEAFSCEFYDASRIPLDVNYKNIKQVLGPHTQVACLVQPELWAAPTGFGCSLVAKQVKMQENETKLGQCLV